MSVLPDGTNGKSWESPELPFLKILRFSFRQYGYRFAGKDKTSAMVFLTSSVVHCVAYNDARVENGII